jgi:GT2 family glycosyltransferase
MASPVPHPSASDDRAETLGLVICTYTSERTESLRMLLASVREGTRQPDRILVVVDRNEELAVRLREELTPGFDVVLSTEGGLSAARNMGWRRLDTTWVSFVDDDATVDRDCFSELLSASEPSVGVLGGAVDPVWPEEGRPDWYVRRLGWVVGCSYDGLPRRTGLVRGVIGCNMAIRRSLLELLEGFDAALGRTDGSLIGSEETELCVRASQAGYGVVYVPGARVNHFVPAARTRIRYALRRGWGEGRSKARMTARHGKVLGLEQRYTRALLREALRRSVRAVRGEHREAARSAALLVTFGATALGYAVERVHDLSPGDR